MPSPAIARITASALAAALLASGLAAQTVVSFECYPAGALPLVPAGSCQGVTSNGLGGSTGQTGVATVANCGFPASGSRYLRVDANGPVAVGAGGPFPRPPATGLAPAEVRVPIPAASATVAFQWNFFNSEGPGSATFNDGMDVAVVDPSGGLVQQLVYADNQIPYGGCFDVVSGFGTEVLPAGVKSFSGPLPALTGCEYLSILCWNGGDNAVSSVALLDQITFDSGAAACPVPCFAGPPDLVFNSPGGAGCVRARVSGMPQGGSWFLAVTLTAGAFPQGWFFGIDVALTDLVLEVGFGFPFSGSLDPCGAAVIGQFCGVTSGISLYAVALGIDGPVLGPWSLVSPAVHYVIP
jgi:hypothetical protein